MLNKRKIKLNKTVIILGGIVVLLLLFSLFFASYLEKLFLLKPNLDYISSGALEVHFVGVGQGDAILVKLPNNETMLVDAGPKTAEAKLLDYIDKFFFRTNNKIFNHVVLTHSDTDHAGNMVAILNKYDVENFYRPKIYSEKIEYDVIEDNPSYKSVNSEQYDDLIAKLKELEDTNKTNIIFSTEGLLLDFNNDFNVNFLSPHLHTYSDINDFSPIMVIEFDGAKFMLTGDATENIERYVINNYPESYLDVDVLKLGHHGSKTSTSYSFLEAVKPEYAIISAEKNNSYNHPHPDVISNIYEYSIQNSSELKNNVLSTADLGNIVFYKNLNSNLSYVNIANSSNYYFVQWWIVVIVGVSVTVVITYRSGVKVNKGKATR